MFILGIMLGMLSRHWLIFTLAGVGILYGLSLEPLGLSLHNTLHVLSTMLITILVMGAGERWGLQAGFLVGMLSLPVNLSLSYLDGETIWYALFDEGVLPSTIVLTTIGLVVVRLRKLNSQLAERTRELEYQTLHDSLTKLPNRLLFFDRLKHTLERTNRRKEPLALLYVDLDNFKLVNDGLGHKAGDLMLIGTARRLENCLRSEDTVARLSGDEFVILLEIVTSVSDATRVAERIAVELKAPFFLEGQEIHLAASIGISLYTGSADRHHTLPTEEQATVLLREADAAMYRAKAEGRAGYEVFDTTMYSHALERLKLANDLSKAIKQGELRVHYQPKVQLKTGRIYAMEALLRWEHPEQGVLSPLKFIPIAEESSLILSIGQWVIREACRQARQWRDKHPDCAPLEVCVNLSARQFQDPTLAEDIVRNLRETGLAPDTLVLEITEHVLMKDAASTVATLEKLKTLGVKLAIDDFGTGYSSLSYLKRFSVDYLKIDRSIIRDLGQDPKNDAIVAATITLAHALSAQVVAEGVESSEQLTHLRRLECDTAQGFYFYRPLPSEAAIAAACLETLENKPGRRLE